MRQIMDDKAPFALRMPDCVKTDSLYVPEKKPLHLWTNEQLRRGLCPRANGRVEACKTCKGKCRFGSALLERLEKEENQP